MNRNPSPLAQEAALRFRLAGVLLPEDRAEGCCAVAALMLENLHWLRGPREAAAEPAEIFSPLSAEGGR